MTTCNFDALFSHRSVALIGASDKAGRVGNIIGCNLLEAGFKGPVKDHEIEARPIHR
jgi:acetyltransferase